MSWLFAAVALVSATVATLSNDLRYSILCLWITGLGVGAIFLTIDAEFLGIIQWIMSTLVAISFIFFAVMFGDFGAGEKKYEKPNYLLTFCSVSVGLGFSLMVFLATEDNSTNISSQNVLSQKFNGIDIQTIGKALVGPHFLSLEILAITLFIVLIGCGSITKIEKGNQK